MGARNNSGLCDQCKATGLPILPVRYAAVPAAAIRQALPGWVSGQRVTDVNIGPEFHYALRTLRTGYVYLFYDKNARGSKQWECYTVGEDGCLRLQPNLYAPMPQQQPEFQCRTAGHTHMALHYLVIEQPHKCGATWIAFSEHAWSKETIDEYTKNTKLRNARMQTLHPKEMAGGAKHSHGQIASAQALEGVLEYQEQDVSALLPHDAKIGAFSQESGAFDKDALSRLSTRYAWHLRSGQGEKTVKHMQARAKAAGSHDKDSTPHVLALWDAIGIAHELNGFFSEGAGRLAQYAEERELQIACSNYLKELQAAAAGAAEDDAKQQRALAFSVTDQRQHGTGQAMHQLAAQHPGDPRYAEAADLQTQWESRRVPSYYSQRMYTVLQYYPANMWRGEIDKLKAEVDRYLVNRDPNFQGYVADVRLHSWDRFDKYLNTQSALIPFRRNWDTFQDAAGKLLETRAQALIHWLEAPLLIDTLEDCHRTCVADGLIFEDYVSRAIAGMGTCAAGARKLDAWVKEAKASIANLLWRTIALNQEKGIDDLNAALAAAEAARADRTIANASNLESNLAKVGKALLGVYKSAAGILAANNSAKSGDSAFGATIKAINTRGADGILTTAGDAIVRHFGVANTLADALCEKIMQHLLSVRALIAPEDSRTLIVYQAADEPAARGKLLERLATADTFLSEASREMREAQSERLKAAWQRVAAAGEDKLRAPRIAALMLVVEALNFNKLLYDCYQRNDWKSWSSLAASGMTIASGLIDIACVPIKEEMSALGDKGAASWSLQRLKLAGGLLSVAATAIGAFWDGTSANENREKNRLALYVLYTLKSGLGAVSLGFTLATTFTHAAPLLGKLWKGQAMRGAAEAVGTRAGEIIGARILFMSVSGWLNVIIFGIQVIIWIQPDDLQVWCERCAFGKSRDKNWTPKQQYDELEKALKSIGIK